jgi:hypothetical protein
MTYEEVRIRRERHHYLASPVPDVFTIYSTCSIHRRPTPILGKMSDDESFKDEQLTALMAKVRSEQEAGEDAGEDDNDDKPKKRSKKKKKKKEKSKGDAGEDEGGDAVEKNDKKKKKKSKEKEKKGKSKEKNPDDAASMLSPSKKSKKKAKDKAKDKSSKKDKKDKKKKKKSGSENDNEPEAIKASPPVVLDPIDYVDDDDGDDSETSEDRKMKELLHQWDGDEESSSSSSSDEDDEEAEGAPFEGRRMTKAELGLQDNSLDHIVLAAPDFAEAVKEFEAMTGIKPSVGGSLKGLGTLTARIGLDNQAFIEIIAPNPKSAGPLGAQLMNLEEGSLIPIHYAIRQNNLSDLADDYVPNELGYDPDRIAMFRQGIDGAPTKWELLFMHGHFHGGTVPYFVDWGECEHPIGSIAQVGSLKGLKVSCPAGSTVHELLKGIKDVTVVDGELGLEFSFSSPEGTITFSGDNPPGLKFPGMDILLVLRVSYRNLSMEPCSYTVMHLSFAQGTGTKMNRRRRYRIMTRVIPAKTMNKVLESPRTPVVLKDQMMRTMTQRLQTKPRQRTMIPAMAVRRARTPMNPRTWKMRRSPSPRLRQAK